ncbi:MAG TPA: amino acid permease [Candidatus Binatia bacterium]|jgi:APA family basic amino acid/polyamine antiporter|nr:amino acid permease [Candidatus Binatia bacterium]
MEQTTLKRKLGLFDAVMIICGDMIGSGIFFATGAIAETLPSPGGVLLVWIFGGLLALTGALSCAELSASLPYAGGDYIYIREAYGKLMGFLSGWSSFLVTFSGAIAFLAVSFTGFMAFFFPVLGSEEALFSAEFLGLSIGITVGTIFSIVVVLLISTLHCIGVRQGTITQNLLTTLKIGALVGIILLGVLFGKGDTAHFTPLFDWEKITNFSLFGAAFIPAIFAYSGWNAIIYIAGEVREPERNLPRALLMGNLIVIALYLLINMIYIYAVPVTEMKGALRVSEVATTALFGYQTSAWITGIITVSVLGALNVVTMLGPRIYYAMARDGVFFKSLARVHPNFGTPISAIILQAIWACFLIVTGTFGTLFTFVSVIITLFSALTVGSVIVLRWKRPELNRPYKLWGYPIVPIVFILAHLWIVWGSLIEKPLESLWGVVIVGLGIPAYFFWSRSKP